MTNFKLHKEFGEIKIFNYDRFEDNRGYFSEIYVKDMVHEHLADFKIEQINLSEVKERNDYTNLQGELACAGGSCEIF